jgi:YHS domain-containing protein
VNLDTLKTVLWWLILGGVFFWMMRRGGCGMMAHDHGGRRGSDAGDDRRLRSESGKPIDPVCGMEVKPAQAVGTRLVDGHTFFFCSQRCLETFDRNPTAYAHGAHEGTSHRHQHAGC